MARKKSKPTLAQVKKKLRDGECATVMVKGKEKNFCKLADKIRESAAPT